MDVSSCTTPFSLALSDLGERIFRPKFSVLFRRGDRASGIFVVISGEVSLDFEANGAAIRRYGSGTLVGLPSTLTRRPYAMTATVTRDAELRFWSPEAFDTLLRNNPEFYPELLLILGEKLAESNQMQRAILMGESSILRQRTSSDLHR